MFGIDTLLDDDERDIAATVRRFVDTRLRPNLAEWFEKGELPGRELAKEFGELGLLGMHLEGYGCAGTNAVSYGLACMELGRATVDCAASSRSRARCRCSRFTDSAPKNRSRNGCPGWPAVTRSAASA